MIPTPGSDAALEQSCTCPVLDNAHGKGFPWGDIKQAFWVSADCPLHGGHPETEEEAAMRLSEPELPEDDWRQGR